MLSLEEAMRQSEDGIEQLDDGLITPVNDIFMINPETRVIEVPESERLFGVIFDKDVEKKYFKCPKIVGDNIDLSKHKLYIVYQSSNETFTQLYGELGMYYCEDMKQDETGDYITFSWLLSANVFENQGFIAFKVVAKYVDESTGNVKTRWNTIPSVGTVRYTLPDGEVIEKEYADIITQLLEKIDSVGGADTFTINVASVRTEGTTGTFTTDKTAAEIKKALRDEKKIYLLTNAMTVYNDELEAESQKILLPMNGGGIVENLVRFSYVDRIDEDFYYYDFRTNGDMGQIVFAKNFDLKVPEDENKKFYIKQIQSEFHMLGSGEAGYTLDQDAINLLVNKNTDLQTVVLNHYYDGKIGTLDYIQSTRKVNESSELLSKDIYFQGFMHDLQTDVSKVNNYVAVVKVSVEKDDDLGYFVLKEITTQIKEIKGGAGLKTSLQSISPIMFSGKLKTKEIEGILNQKVKFDCILEHKKYEGNDL